MKQRRRISRWRWRNSTSRPRAVLLTLSVVRAFADEPAICPLLTSAPRSCALRHRSVRGFRTRRRPPEVRLTTFAAHPPNLPPRPLMAMDFAIIGSLSSRG